MKPNRIASQNQTTISAKALRRYDAKTFTLIPLHAYNAKARKRGKERKLGKVPIDKNWSSRTDYNSARVRADAIKENRNVGVRLNADQLVIDVDPRNGGDKGFANLCKALHMKPSDFPTVITGSGGLHLYMTKPAELLIVDTLVDFPGVEFKSKGRQVVAAGSIHPDTLKLYEWDGRVALIEDGLPDAPEALLNVIARPDREVMIRGGGQMTQEQVAEALERLNPEDFRTESEWRDLMMACHHASNGDARSEFVEWSTSDRQYMDDAEIIGRRWDSLHTERKDGGDVITVRSLLKAVREKGDGEPYEFVDHEERAEDFEALAAEGDGTDLDHPDAFEGVAESASTAISLVESRGLKLNHSGVAPDTFENALCAVVRSELQPAWDELKQNVVFRAANLPWDESYGRVLNDNVGRVVRVHLLNTFQGVAYSPSKDHLFEALFSVAYGNKFNPVIDYIDPLQWDGVLRVENLFGRYFNCGDDPYTRAVSVCFMVGAVRRMRKPGCKFDTMPILRSPQGWNKSSGVRALFGDEFFSDADLGSLRDKDAAMKLRGIWGQEFAELESLTRAETGALKAFCSRATDRQRDPYGRVVEDVPRRCVFIGTTNEGGYLKDSTGARRFWPLDLSAPIDVARLVADRDQLWAEAAHMEAQGVSDVLPRELWSVAAERQAEQTSGDPWADLLRDFLALRARDAEDPDEYPDGLAPLPADRVLTSELFKELDIEPADQTKDKAQRLRTVMESTLGWQHSRGVRVHGQARAGYTKEKLKAWRG